jgi:hypothetical protein
MNAKQLISQLRARPNAHPQNLGIVFRCLAHSVYDARLVDGQRLLDATDFKAWLLELAEASTVHDHSFAGSPRRSLQDTCPRCGHIHQGEAECGEDLGGGRICRCELPVPA